MRYKPALPVMAILEVAVRLIMLVLFAFPGLALGCSPEIPPETQLSIASDTGMEGTVTGGGSPLLGIRVLLYDTATGLYVKAGITSPDGRYSVTGLNAGAYKVFFGVEAISDYYGQWYANQTSYGAATPVTVTAGAITSGIDAVLQPLADDAFEPNNSHETATSITTGTLYEHLIYTPGTGGPDCFRVYVDESRAGQVLGIQLQVTSGPPFDPPAGWSRDLDFIVYDSGGHLLSLCLSTDFAEETWLPCIQAGWYYIDLVYCTTWFETRGTGCWAEYSLYTVLDTAAALGIGTITGQVTDSLGNGLDLIPVQAEPVPASRADPFPWVMTGPGGQFCIGARPGGYTLAINAQGVPAFYETANYLAEYYDNQPQRSTASLLSVNAGGGISGLHIMLGEGCGISGLLTDPSGSPMSARSATVRVLDSHGALFGSTLSEADGTYRLTGIPPGIYFIYFTGRNNHASEYYQHKPSRGVADPLPLTAGSITGGIDHQFTLAAGITGTVTSDTGTPLSGIPVELYDTGGNLIRTVPAASAGTFNLNRLPAGEAKLRFDGSAQGYRSSWYNNQDSFASATVLVSTAGTVLAGIAGSLLPIAGNCDLNLDGVDDDSDIDVMTGFLADCIEQGSALFPAPAGKADLDANGTVNVRDLMLRRIFGEKIAATQKRQSSVPSRFR